VPVDGELDLKRLAAGLGARSASLAEPTEAERVTGYVIGGISPLAGRRPLPVVLDDSATGHATIFVSAGRRGLQVELAPADLARVVNATRAPLRRTIGPGNLVKEGE
jgi:Cys-tRNA(Pro)/Cys-tRNA(Cys) deacylase